ncbi:sensor histidine kinase [Amycolatopsis thermoflava]|uniref:sensor histidine kinase n=1 Tax=Amycolatopsis thermoflava TaxID=84480 RepID=UPI001428AE83|nr:HAMP domain-containing sensor histidine kinase [Amycolatopsis thermoflava]
MSSVLLLEASMTARADGQLTRMAAVLREGWLAPPTGGSELPTEYSLQVYSESGELRWAEPGNSDEGPAVSTDLVLSSSTEPVTVPDRAGGANWRAMALRTPDGERAVVAVSLESQEDTVSRLLLIELAVGALILGLVATVGRIVVRLGLRPLTRIEHTATAIAEGEVQLRVTETDPHTETGQLGRALNTMLARLAQALRDLESSERRLRTFVADASHELRTPLTSIRGFAELYRHGGATRDPAAERVLWRIEDEATRMGAMVEDLLLLARLDREPGLDLSEIDLCDLAEDVVGGARARHPERTVSLHTPGERVRVLGDEQRLHQVVANLVANALVHSPADAEVRVSRMLASEVPSGDPAGVGGPIPPDTVVALVEVHDDGPGIDPEHLPFVFDRFYRADPARSPGGSGLGLAISAALVEAHDGVLSVASSQRSGTTFRVVLPVSGPGAADR